MNNVGAKIKMRLPVITLLGVSLLFWEYYDRYEAVGPELISSPTLADATRIQGDCSEVAPHVFKLQVPEPGKTARFNIPISGAAAHKQIRIRGRIKVDGIDEGRYPWSCARLLLAQYDKDGKWISVHHTLRAESGTRDWKEHENVFVLQPDAAQVDMVVQQIGLSGTAYFDQLTAEPVGFKASFKFWRTGFIGLWLAMAVLFFRRCRLDRRKLRILILLNASVILVGTLMPEYYIEHLADELKHTATTVFTETPATEGVQADKAVPSGHGVDIFNAAVGSLHKTGHFLLFASLCFLVYVSAALENQKRIYFVKVGFDLLLFASISESLQYLTVDRTPGITDWLTDVYGMLAALAVFVPLSLLIRRIVPSG